MSNEKWTTGPWRFSHAHGDIISMSAEDSDIVCDTDKYSRYAPYLVKQQDANLIAAAPELYEALDSLRKWALDNHCGEVPTELVADVEYAMAKAKGEHQ